MLCTVLPGPAWRLDELIGPDRGTTAEEGIKYTPVQHKIVDGAIMGDRNVES